MPSSLLVDLQAALVALALILPRTLVCLSILPSFGTQTLTGFVRRAVALAMALPAVLPTFEFVQQTPPDLLFATILCVKEAAIGAIFGVLLSIPVWVAQSIGSIFELQRSPIQTPANNNSVDKDASAIGALLLQAVVIIMIQAGLLSAMARLMIESYGIWPAFHLTPPFEVGHLEVLIKKFAEFFWHIVVYGGPVIIPLLLIDLGFAVLGVFAQNLQVSFASSPVKCLVGLFILLIYWPIFSHYVANDFSQIMDFSINFLQATRQ